MLSSAQFVPSLLNAAPRLSNVPEASAKVKTVYCRVFPKHMVAQEDTMPHEDIAKVETGLSNVPEANTKVKTNASIIRS